MLKSGCRSGGVDQEATVTPLDRTGILREQRSEFLDLFDRSLDRLLVDRPGQAFRTGRRRQRAHVTEVTAVLRHDGRDIDRTTNFLFGTFLWRHRVEEYFQSGIRRARPYEHTRHRERSRGRLVDEVTFEIEALPRQQMFARMMKMKLQQLVTRATDHAGTAGLGIDLDGVTVIEDAKRQRLVVVIDRTDVALDAVAQIDRSLLQAELANPKVGLQLSPFFRAAVAFVTPMRGGGAMRRCVRGNGGAGLEAASTSERAAQQHSTIDRHFMTPGFRTAQGRMNGFNSISDRNKEIDCHLAGPSVRERFRNEPPAPIPRAIRFMPFH